MSNRVERAAEIGREHREVFIAEFGEPPIEGQVGDWDVTGLGDTSVTEVSGDVTRCTWCCRELPPDLSGKLYPTCDLYRDTNNSMQDNNHNDVM